MADEITDAIKNGVVSKKHSITVFKRAVNKHSKAAMDALVLTMTTTKDERLKADIAKSLLKLHADMIKMEADEKHRTKEFYLKNKDELLRLASGGITISENEEEDEEAASFDFETVEEVE